MAKPAELTLQPNDLAALQAIRDAMSACNAAETMHLRYQTSGTFGFIYDAFIDAATVLLGGRVRAGRLLHIIMENGEDVTQSLANLNQELCGVCRQWIDEYENHCLECGTCKGDKHSKDCNELVCLGHETTDGPMGVSVYCDGACRSVIF